MNLKGLTIGIVLGFFIGMAIGSVAAGVTVGILLTFLFQFLKKSNFKEELWRYVRNSEKRPRLKRLRKGAKQTKPGKE